MSRSMTGEAGELEWVVDPGGIGLETWGKTERDKQMSECWWKPINRLIVVQLAHGRAWLDSGLNHPCQSGSGFGHARARVGLRNRVNKGPREGQITGEGLKGSD